MKSVGQVVKHRSVLMAILLLMVGNAWASQFTEKVERIFSPSVIGALKEEGTTGEVTFQAPGRMPDYFDTGDKANKIFAIEAARVFRDVPTLEHLTLNVPKAGSVQTLDISRSDLEQFYEISFSAMSNDPDIWRSQFIQRYDNKESRAKFVGRFVITK